MSLITLLNVIVFIGALNWGVVALTHGTDLFGLLGLGAGPTIAFYTFVAVSALFLAFQRDTWLPFLGKSAFPSALVKQPQSPEGANVTVKLENLPPYAGVVYWAAESDQPENTTYQNAYQDYSNSGTTSADQSGTAILLLRCPSQYFVPFRSKLPKHLHYRLWDHKKPGLLGPVQTVVVDC